MHCDYCDYIVFAAKRPDLEPSCSLALEVGLCNSRELKWFFNVTSDKCQAFNYTGCRGNGNRFDSKEACGLTCTASACSPVRCLMFCPFGFVKDDNGCDICRCINPCRVRTCSLHITFPLNRYEIYSRIYEIIAVLQGYAMLTAK